MFKINIIHIFIPLAIVSVVICYPAKNTPCDCVCGLKENDTSVDINKKPHQNPWTVGVFWGRTDDPSLFGCSGSLISNEHVLVSATCADKMDSTRRRLASKIQIRMGNDVMDAIKRNIKRFYIYEKYQEIWSTKGTSYDFDIAILQMDEPVSFDNNIQPICLPQSPFVEYNNHTLVTAIGSYDTGTLETLYHRTKTQQTHIPIWMLDDCAEFRNYDRKITENMLCVGDRENEIQRPYFHGFDYGQIIVENKMGSMELVGIFSFGPRDSYSLSDAPLVYTRVANFLPWIQSILGNQCMCKPRNFTQNDSLNVQMPKKQTQLSLQSAKNSTCNCACGLRGGNDEKRIINGIKVTRPNRLPWVVGVYYVKDSGYHYLSSGALISNKYVISSAECAYKLKLRRNDGHQLEIHLGQINPVYRGISSIYDHADWNSENMDFNIGILQLDETVSFGYNIQPICLPNSSSFVNYTVGQIAISASYFQLFTYNRPHWSMWISIYKSQEHHVPIWSNEQCAKQYYYKNITDNMICAGEYEYGIRRTCMEELDFGQLVIEREGGSMELIGIYSFGTKCGSIGMPPVYTRVANLLPWIQSRITNDQCTYAPKGTDHNNNLEETCVINQN